MKPTDLYVKIFADTSEFDQSMQRLREAFTSAGDTFQRLSHQLDTRQQHSREGQRVVEIAIVILAIVTFAIYVLATFYPEAGGW